MTRPSGLAHPRGIQSSSCGARMPQKFRRTPSEQTPHTSARPAGSAAVTSDSTRERKPARTTWTRLVRQRSEFVRPKLRWGVRTGESAAPTIAPTRPMGSRTEGFPCGFQGFFQRLRKITPNASVARNAQSTRATGKPPLARHLEIRLDRDAPPGRRSFRMVSKLEVRRSRRS